MVRGGPADVPVIMRLLDDAVDWLASSGRTGQWGTEHWSRVPAAVAGFTELATFTAKNGTWPGRLLVQRLSVARH